MPGVDITGRGLTREYPAGERSQTALDHVDIDVAAGSLVAITGPSGSGKSTLLHVIGGMDILTSGTLKVGDTQLDELPPQETGHVSPQSGIRVPALSSAPCIDRG